MRRRPAGPGGCPGMQRPAAARVGGKSRALWPIGGNGGHGVDYEASVHGGDARRLPRVRGAGLRGGAAAPAPPAPSRPTRALKPGGLRVQGSGWRHHGASGVISALQPIPAGTGRRTQWVGCGHRRVCPVLPQGALGTRAAAPAIRPRHGIHPVPMASGHADKRHL